jgi:hypothetical protein
MTQNNRLISVVMIVVSGYVIYKNCGINYYKVIFGILAILIFTIIIWAKFRKGKVQQ